MPVLFIEAPPGIRPEAKRKMVQKLTEAIDDGLPHRRHSDFPPGVFDGKCSHGRKAAIGKSQNPGSPQENKCRSLARFFVTAGGQPWKVWP